MWLPHVRARFVACQLLQIKVPDPPAALWLCQAQRDLQYLPCARHAWWRHVLLLAATDPGVDERLFLVALLKTAVADGHNIGNMQAWEFSQDLGPS